MAEFRTFKTSDGKVIAGKQRYKSRRNAERGREAMARHGYWTTRVRPCTTWPDEWGFGYSGTMSLSDDLAYPPTGRCGAQIYQWLAGGEKS